MIRNFAEQSRRARAAAVGATADARPFVPPAHAAGVGATADVRPFVGPMRLVTVPSLLLQTVIVPGERTDEGTLIEAVALPWFDIIAFLKADPGIAFQIPWAKWEEIIAAAYKRAGFDEVILTPRSGDHGRDVIAVKKGLGFVRVIDQVKAYTPPHLVTADDVRALVGVVQMDGASKGFLSTTSDFAPKIKSDPLLNTVMPSRIELINGTALFARLEELARR
jgi:restriction system protein